MTMLQTMRSDIGRLPDQKTVSVIVPTYNYAFFLPTAIASVLAQGWKDEELEILIVDDGSTDNTEEIARHFQNLHLSVRYVRQDNAGLSAARNCGIQMAQGDYIVFLDADDMLAPGYLRSQLGYLEEHPEVDIAVAANQLVRSLGPVSLFRSIGTWRLCRDWQEIHLYCSNIAPPHAFTMRKKVFNKERFFDTSLAACEDYDFWFTCCQDGLKFGSNAQAMVLYRRHPSSMSANTARQSLHDCILLERVFQALCSAPDDNLTYGKLIACIYGCLKVIRRILPFDVRLAKDIVTQKLVPLLDRTNDYHIDYAQIQPYAHIVQHYQNMSSIAARLPRLISPVGKYLTLLQAEGINTLKLMYHTKQKNIHFTQSQQYWFILYHLILTLYTKQKNVYFVLTRLQCLALYRLVSEINRHNPFFVSLVRYCLERLTRFPHILEQKIFKIFCSR